MKIPPLLFYVLDADHHVVPARNVLEWAQFFESSARRIVAVHERPDWTLSTVFIGLPDLCLTRLQGTPGGLFETALFMNDRVRDSWKHDTWDEANAFHMAKFVELADQDIETIRDSS